MSERRSAPASLPDAAAPSGERSAGRMLRELREAAGVDPALLASAMKVSTQKLDALENDRLDQLPGLTFARGLASAICRAFGVDPAPVLERMPMPEPGLRPLTPGINQVFRRSGDGPTPILVSDFSRPLVITVLLLLLGAAALWLLPTLPIQLSAPATADAPAPDAGVVQESVEPASAPAVEPAPAELPLDAASAEQVPPAPAAAAASAEAPVDLLQFTATAETWVTVRDAAGKPLINRALAAGETVAINGDLPLLVTIGRKDAVDVRVRGEPFDHRSLSKTTVARFQVQ